MDALDRLIDEISQEAGNLDEMDSYEVANYLKRKGVPTSKANSIANSMTNQMTSRQEARASVGKGSVLGMYASEGTPTSSAQFDIVITRNSANIVGVDLPVCIFGPLDLENEYSQVITLPTGAAVIVTSGYANDRRDALRFSYTVGANTDTVDITCQQYPYPSFIKATMVDLFRLSKIRYTISDTTLTDQFQKQFKVVERSLFGKVNTNAISVSAYKDPRQFQAGIIDLNAVIDIDSETCILTSIRPTAAFSVTLSIFVEKFNKFNAHGKL